MGKFIDLTGQKFNKLTVIEKFNEKSFNSITWSCICDCGKKRNVRSADLRRSKVISCGDPKCRKNFIDIANKIIGKLKVIKLTDEIYSNGDIGWLCRCECGIEKIIRGQTLRSGTTKSCGEYRCQSCFLDIANKVFGKLTVLKFSHSVGEANSSCWECRCSCGNTIVLPVASLIGGTLDLADV